MRVISCKKLKDFWRLHPRSEKMLRAWYADARQARWNSPQMVRNVYRNASIVANNRIIFNIKGNSYRLVAAINYSYGIVYIRFIGTHAAYDKIDAATV